MKPLLVLSPLLLPPHLARAILPTSVLEISSLQLLASQASFGPPPATYARREEARYAAALPGGGADEHLCGDPPPGDSSASFGAGTAGAALVVPRGKCSFQRKALNAQKMGAAAVVVYGTLSSRYDYNSTAEAMVWPADKQDYDCDRGSALIPEGEFDRLDFGGGYNPRNDLYLSGLAQGNLCLRYSESREEFAEKCSSAKCLVTGRNSTVDGGPAREACCAWDLHVWLYGDPSMAEEEAVSIPAVYITAGEAELFLDVLRGAADRGESPTVGIYQRYVPRYNFSAALIWAFGVWVAWAASWMSSRDYRRVSKGVEVRRGSGADAADGSGENAWSRSLPRSSSSAERGAYRAPAEQPPDAAPSRTSSGVGEDPESVELTASHALGFVVMASASLLVLFFFKIYNVVKIAYAFGCSGAFMQVCVHPALRRGFERMRWERPLRPLEWFTEEKAREEAGRGGFKGKAFPCLWEFFGPVAPADVVAAVLSYGVGAAWLYAAFAVPHPDALPFYWVVQDIFGACMCILFLSTIKLNSVKVAAILLTVAFFYDIFFVFVTPLLTKHGESIMVNVATTGGPPKADPSWCEKYPFDADCKGGDPLPMLFAVPRIGDYQGGCSMLGLGDIVLPGLLLSFASRYDEAKRLIGVIGGGSGRMRSNACPDVPQNKSTNPLCFICCCCRRGYFGPVMVAYAIGLAMANAAVYLMQMGQPALLYLVPCCLGTMVYIGHKSGELDELWEGPRVIRAADGLLYGEPQVESGDDERERTLVSESEAPMANESEAELT